MSAASGATPFAWSRRQLERIASSAATTAPAVRPWRLPRVLEREDIWDLWPVQEEDGMPVVVGAGELWMTLSAPAVGHPEARHDVARLRLIARRGDRWEDLGPAFADGGSPGSREWSGSAVRHADGTLSIYYTAAGRRGEERLSFGQRVIEARTRLVVGDDGRARFDRDVEHRELLRPDGRVYLGAETTEGGPGRIKAFRDPAWFRDPADGSRHLLVAASVPWRERFMGAVALATEGDGGWSLRPPLLVADGVNHELERPHVVTHGGRYHLFLCTHRSSFHPCDSAPTGLYGFVAPALTGPYEPLNGTGLVIANPAEQPDQAYAWWVLPDLRVVSFQDYRGSGERSMLELGAEEARARFGGTIAPVLRIELDGARSRIVPTAEAR